MVPVTASACDDEAAPVTASAWDDEAAMATASAWDDETAVATTARRWVSRSRAQPGIGPPGSLGDPGRSTNAQSRRLAAPSGRFPLVARKNDHW